MADTQTYRVHARNAGHSHGHRVDAGSFEEAAVAFVESWQPPIDADNEVSIIVQETQSGVEHCFRIDLDSGEAAPCS